MSDAIREALQTLRENIRQEGRTVQQIGIRDNDDTRNAIAVLLDNEAALQSQTAPAVPDGWMLVRKEWQPIMDEVDRRADKCCGLECDFTIQVEADDYRAIDEAERTPPPTHQPVQSRSETQALYEFASELEDMLECMTREEAKMGLRLAIQEALAKAGRLRTTKREQK